LQCSVVGLDLNFEDADREIRVLNRRLTMTDSTTSEQDFASSTSDLSKPARDFALHAADRVRDGAASAHEQAQQATKAAESLATGAVTELARISRVAQTAVFDDVKAAIDAFTDITRAKTLADAAQIQFDYLGARSRVNVERVQSAVEFVKTKFSDGYAKWTDKAA
jgi:hypothetical protein